MNDAIEIELMEEILNKGNELQFKALGGSMYPLIRSGDIITVKPIKIGDVTVGDIIFYKNKNKYFVHRLIKIVNDKSTFITRGDFLPQYDDPIDSSQILGKVVAVKRGNKTKNYNTYWMRKFNSLIILIYPLFYPVLTFIYKVLTAIFKIKRVFKL